MLSLRGKVLKADERVWKRMKKNLMKGQQLAVNVGWMDGAIHSSEKNTMGVTQAQVAKWGEEGHANGGAYAGTITMARPAIRQGFMHIVKNTSWLQAYVSFAFPRLANGTQTWTQFNHHLGKNAVDLMQQTIKVWNIPLNTQHTAELKGFNDPLIETGETVNSIQYKVARKESGGND